MKQINTYINEKLVLNKDNVKDYSDDNGIKDRDDALTRDFKKLYRLISDECGNNHETLESLLAMSNFNDDYTEFYYKWDKYAWSVFLRDIVNYDIITLKEDGTIDIKNSNHKEIAKLVDKYNVPEIGKRIYMSF